MAYPYPYYQPPAPDQLSQLRQQYQQPVYQPYPQMQQQMQPQVQPQQGGQSMIWVNGEQEAMSYLVVPNSAVALWDSTAPVIYLKQADASGKPSIKIYDLVERTASRTPVTAPQVEYATQEQLNKLAARLEALESYKQEDIADE